METDTISYASAFANGISLWFGILIGAIASVLVLRAAYKMGGGLFGSVLKFIGTGMILIVLGALARALIPSTFDVITQIIYTALFGLGYICMVLGANKLLKGIMS